MSASLEEELRRELTCDVCFDTFSRSIYSVDASIYEIEPVGVVIPRTQQDLEKAVQIASAKRVPIHARGAATGIAGGCIGRGLVIDTARHLTRILEINLDEEYALCEPGVVQDQLNQALSPHGYRLGPDTSTGNRATIGGMIGNNAAGARSLRFGKMLDHVLEMDLLLANGERVRIGPDAPKTTTVRSLEEDVLRIKDVYEKDIKERFPDIPRRVSGYNLDHLTDGRALNLCRLIAGAEGSLGVVAQVKLKIVPKPKETGLLIIHCADMVKELKRIPELLTRSPLSLELIDKQIIKMGRLSPSMRGRLDWLNEDPAALLVFECDGPDKETVMQALREHLQFVKTEAIGTQYTLLSEPQDIANVWALRKAGLGLLLSRRSYSRAIGFLEDVAVDPKQIGAFMELFTDYLSKHNKSAGIYGHVGAGCIHVRPFINLRNADDVQLMQRMMEDIADLLLQHDGSLSGEHGDGLVRSWLNRKMFGEAIYQAFCKLKHAFDPHNLMNPGKVVHAPPLTQDLRMTPETQQNHIQTLFDFTREGGFELAVDMCNGNGQCRKREGLMCPSFQAFGEEKHSTRARAQSLRAIVNNRLPIDAFTSEGLTEILDYCLECKGCKTQCPSQVDMAKMKAEMLYQKQKIEGASIRSWLFANVPRLNHIASYTPWLANTLQKGPLYRFLCQKLGIDPERSLPPIAQQRFSRWMAQQRSTPHPSRGKVVLYSDSYTEFNYPKIGRAAYQVLTALGYEVIVPPWTCCGRPLISKGFLEQARRKAHAVVDALYPYTYAGFPVIGLEPSCILTIKDDYRDLLRGNKRQSVVDAIITFDEFLAREAEDGHLQSHVRSVVQSVRLHGHCHQKALVGMEPSMRVLEALPGVEAAAIDAGCCGLAGSFGYEIEHREMSKAIAEDRLAPAVRACQKDTVLVASGLSCRSQIAHMTDRQSLHLAEFLAMNLR